MKPYIKTSQVSSASANAPSESSVGGKSTATKTKTARATKAAGTKTTRAKAATAEKPVKLSAKATKAAAAAAAAPIIPDFGVFRCACCGFTKEVAAGTEKPAGGLRCPSCFVKLDWIRS